MLNTTIDAIRAVLRLDPTVSGIEKTKIIFRLRRGYEERKAPPPREARLLRRETVAERLACSVRMVDRLARDGVLKRIVLPGRKRSGGFREADIDALINGGGGEESRG